MSVEKLEFSRYAGRGSLSQSRVPSLANGVLPPYVHFPEHIDNCSPYHVRLVDVIVEFGNNPTRRRLISGLLAYRDRLRSIGIVRGAQWIDGSFVEGKKSPGDIDVVTFFRRPLTHVKDNDFSQLVDEHGALFEQKPVREMYHCDAYIIDLDADALEIARQAHFWGGLFGHQKKTFKRKGFLQVSLDELEDQEAQEALRGAP